MISPGKDTALHVAILSGHIKIVNELVNLMTQEDLELRNEYGATALSTVAISGYTNMAEAIVNKNANLVSIKDVRGHIPIVVAALYGQKDMVRYLYTETPINELTPSTSSATLLNCLITAEIYDVALDLMQRYPRLAITEDLYRNYTIRILAQKPSAFPSGSKHVFWEQWIHSFLSVQPSHALSICQHNQIPIQGPGDEENITRPQRGSSVGENIISQVLSVQPSHALSIPQLHEIPIQGQGYEENITRPHRGSSVGENKTSQVLSTLRGLVWNISLYFVPAIKHIYDRKLMHVEALELLDYIFKEIPTLSKSQFEKIGIDEAIYDAIKHGIIEFVVKIIKYDPDTIWRKGVKGRTMFAHSIILRQEKIFCLIYGLGPIRKSIIARRRDIFANNILHLAGKLAPSSQLDRVSGTALQMQRELQWFKEVEKIVKPKSKEDVNENNKTPSAVFTEEHADLVKKGERWMKNTATSCMVVATLIAALMFTTAFTVPGGTNNETGIPIFLGYNAFMVFIASDAFSLFSSSTSVLMFLGILTSRYAEEDFLKSLPTKLIIGLFSLFFSIVTMMIAFGSALFIVLRERLEWISIPVIVLATIPITLFVVLQFPLLLEMFVCTYGRGIFHKPTKRP